MSGGYNGDFDNIKTPMGTQVHINTFRPLRRVPSVTLKFRGLANSANEEANSPIRVYFSVGVEFVLA